LYVLRGMPLFRDVSRPDLWELAYKEVAPAFPASETERLIDEVFELGRNNLYGAFDASGTAECYGRLVAILSAAGIPLPPAPDLRDW
jgi:hypothetical protein